MLLPPSQSLPLFPSGCLPSTLSPSTRLVQALCHKVCREIVLKKLLVFKRVVLLPVRHGTAFKPAVKDVVYALENAPAGAGRDGQEVDEVAVKVSDLKETEQGLIGGETRYIQMRRDVHAVGEVVMRWR